MSWPRSSIRSSRSDARPPRQVDDAHSQGAGANLSEGAVQEGDRSIHDGTRHGGRLECLRPSRRGCQRRSVHRHRRQARPTTATQESTPAPRRLRDRIPISSRSRSCPRACGHSTSTTPTFPRAASRPARPMVCPKASGSGRRGSSRPTRTDVSGGPDLRPFGLRQVVAGEGGLLPRLDEAGSRRSHRSNRRRHRRQGFCKDLKKACPELPGELGLADCLAAVRRADTPPGQKLLLVLDQFEQWLHARRGDENTELAAALRQCDGEHVQAIVMVRDDFWMAATRFMRSWRSS